MVESTGSPPAGRRHDRPFWRVSIFLVAFYLFMKFGYTAFAGWVAAPGWGSIKNGLPTGGQELPLYFGLAVLGCVCYLTYDPNRGRAFCRPGYDFLSCPGPKRTVALWALPLAAGGWVFAGALGGGAEPMVNPLRHPTPPEHFSRTTNPFRHPTPKMWSDFADAVKTGRIDAEHSTEAAVVAYVEALKRDAVPAGPSAEGLLQEAFFRHSVEEGRELYQVNCRPCHGTKAMGDGPASWGQRRVPADFTGVETIATLVEGAVFWRIKKGGIGLPAAGAPWESAMPSWEAELKDEDIWKIILAEYDTAGNRPREPERHE